LDHRFGMTALEWRSPLRTARPASLDRALADLIGQPAREITDRIFYKPFRRSHAERADRGVWLAAGG
jgi:hypothetical protein